MGDGGWNMAILDQQSSILYPQSAIGNPQMNPERYSRQILFSGIGKEGQQRLGQSHAVIIGCGALGAMHAEMLARAGVGRLREISEARRVGKECRSRWSPY